MKQPKAQLVSSTSRKPLTILTLLHTSSHLPMQSSMMQHQPQWLQNDQAHTIGRNNHYESNHDAQKHQSRPRLGSDHIDSLSYDDVSDRMRGIHYLPRLGSVERRQAAAPLYKSHSSDLSEAMPPGLDGTVGPVPPLNCIQQRLADSCSMMLSAATGLVTQPLCPDHQSLRLHQVNTVAPR